MDKLQQLQTAQLSTIAGHLREYASEVYSRIFLGPGLASGTEIGGALHVLADRIDELAKRLAHADEVLMLAEKRAEDAIEDLTRIKEEMKDLVEKD